MTQAIYDLYHRFVAVVDYGDLKDLPDLFAEDAIYKIQSRENFDRGFPLATLALESRAMLKDRVYGVTETIYHDPYYQTHILGPLYIQQQADASFSVECNVQVIRTKRDCMPEILCVGRYLDVVVNDNGAWVFKKKHFVFDNDLIANSIIKPV
jgi:salicylate 5-hydroxylase small subunit